MPGACVKSMPRLVVPLPQSGWRIHSFASWEQRPTLTLDLRALYLWASTLCVSFGISETHPGGIWLVHCWRWLQEAKSPVFFSFGFGGSFGLSYLRFPSKKRPRNAPTRRIQSLHMISTGDRWYWAGCSPSHPGAVVCVRRLQNGQPSLASFPQYSKGIWGQRLGFVAKLSLITGLESGHAAKVFAAVRRFHSLSGEVPG